MRAEEWRRSHPAGIDAYKSQGVYWTDEGVEAYAAHVARLLLPYLRHEGDCVMRPDESPCSCGLDAVRKNLQELLCCAARTGEEAMTKDITKRIMGEAIEGTLKLSDDGMNLNYVCSSEQEAIERCERALFETAWPKLIAALEAELASKALHYDHAVEELDSLRTELAAAKEREQPMLEALTAMYEAFGVDNHPYKGWHRLRKFLEDRGRFHDNLDEDGVLLEVVELALPAPPEKP